MSEIKELIERLCPDGVEYKKLGEVCVMQRGTSMTKKNAVEGDIPVISGGREPAFYINQSNREGETITVAGSGAGAGYVQYWNEPIFVNDAFSVKGSDELLTKYVYYCMKNMQEQITGTQKGGGVPHVHISSIDNFEIPVPPIEVQRKIVEILDNFTELEAELERKLESELEARRKQYEYYRNQLLTFDDTRSDVKWMKMSEAAESYTGLTYKPQNISETGKLVLRSSNIQGGVLSFDDNVYVDMQIPLRALVKEGDVLVCVRNGSKKLVGKCAMITKEADGMAFGAFMTVLRAKAQITSKYLFHVWQSDYVKKQYYGDEGMPIAQITKSDFQRITIPIPPLEEQKRIVSILDRFEALTTDLQSGLPAEIEARRKQYEYYREKLLTFKRKTA